MLSLIVPCSLLFLSSTSHRAVLRTPSPRHSATDIRWLAHANPLLRQPPQRAHSPLCVQRARPLSLSQPPAAPIASARSSNNPHSPIAMIEICANQQVTRYQATLTSIRSTQASYRLSISDVRLLRSSTPVLQVRDGYIIFNFGDLQGVLQHDRLTLINAERPAVKTLAEELERRLKTDRDSREEAPFEVRALEAMLEQTYSVIEEGLNRLSPLVSSTLAELTNSPSSSDGQREAALGTLLPLRISLNSLQARARRLNALLDELLDNDGDVADMCLTLQQRLSPLNRLGRLLLDDEDDDDSWIKTAEEEARDAEAAQEVVETVLDVYDARFQALGDQIDQVASNIESTQEILELTLDNERNRIARLELLLSMAGLCIGTCSAVSGFFGMNLLSGVEEVAGLFLLVTGTSIVLTGGLFVVCLRQFRSLTRKQRVRLLDVQALKKVLNHLDGITLLLRNRPMLTSQSMSRMQAELKQILEVSGFPQMNERELRVLCNLLRQKSTGNSRSSYGLTVLADTLN